MKEIFLVEMKDSESGQYFNRSFALTEDEAANMGALMAVDALATFTEGDDLAKDEYDARLDAVAKAATEALLKGDVYELEGYNLRFEIDAVKRP